LPPRIDGRGAGRGGTFADQAQRGQRDMTDAVDRFNAGQWQAIRTNRKLAALRQIQASLAHFEADDFECSVTLALAAESQLPEATGTYLIKVLKEKISSQTDFNILNDLRNWLKHPKEPNERDISEFEVAVALVRAISKYFAAFNEETPEMRAFIEWCVLKKLILRDEEVPSPSSGVNRTFDQ
jgi:hypothetical protein